MSYCIILAQTCMLCCVDVMWRMCLHKDDANQKCQNSRFSSCCRHNSSQDILTSLPEDIAVLICNYLSLQERVVCSMVCKAWTFAIKDMQSVSMEYRNLDHQFDAETWLTDSLDRRPCILRTLILSSHRKASNVCVYYWYLSSLLTTGQLLMTFASQLSTVWFCIQTHTVVMPDTLTPQRLQDLFRLVLVCP